MDDVDFSIRRTATKADVAVRGGRPKPLLQGTLYGISRFTASLDLFAYTTLASGCIYRYMSKLDMTHLLKSSRAHLLGDFLCLDVLSTVDQQYRQNVLGAMPILTSKTNHLLRKLVRHVLEQIISLDADGHLEIPRPLVHRVLTLIQIFEVGELQLDLTKMPIYDGIDLHIPIPARHPVGIKAVRHPVNVFGLQRSQGAIGSATELQ